MEAKQKPLKKSLLVNLRNYFITGFVALSPIVVTIWIVIQILLLMDSVLGKPIHFVLSEIIGVEFFEQRTIYGMGFVTLVLLILLTGWITRQYLGSRFVNLVNATIDHIPFVNKVHTAVMQIAEALLGGRKDVFKTSVLIEFPKPGTWSIAFITQDTRGAIQDALNDDVVSVFVPTTPNPTSGYLLFVPKKSVTPLDISVEEALKLIISAGALTPKRGQHHSEVAAQIGMKLHQTDPADSGS